MASISLQQLRIVEEQLKQIDEAVNYFIENLYELIPYEPEN